MLGINEKIIDTFHNLIGIANDGKYGYEHAAKDIDDPVLKQMFRQYSLERTVYVEDLKKEVVSLGGASQDAGTIGTLHDTWVDIKDVTSGDRDMILQICIKGEEAAIKAYTKAYDDKNIPAHTKPVILQQLSSVQFALNSIRALAMTAAT